MARGKYLVAIVALTCFFCLSLIIHKRIVNRGDTAADSRVVAAAENNNHLLSRQFNPAAQKPSRDAYVTLLYGGFLLGARVLGQSLRETGTKMDMIALCTENVAKSTKEVLIADGWRIKEIGNIHSPYQGLSKRGDYFSGIFSKLYVWNLTDYERIIYLDSDVLVLQNIDHMFDCGTFCATYRHSDLFNAGIIVVQPSSNIFYDMLDKIPVIPSYDDGDQGFLNVYFSELVYAPFFNWNNASRQNQPMRMPTELNADIATYYISSSWSIRGEIRIIHYTLGPIKPWIWWTDRLFDLNSRWTSVRMRLPEYDGHSDKYKPFYLPLFWIPYPVLGLLYVASTRCGEMAFFRQNKYVFSLLSLFIWQSSFFSHVLPLPTLIVSYYLAMHIVPTTMLSSQAEYVFWLWTSFFVLLFMGAYCSVSGALVEGNPSNSWKVKIHLCLLFLVFTASHFLVAFAPCFVDHSIRRLLVFFGLIIVHFMVCQVIGQWAIRTWTRQQKRLIRSSIKELEDSQSEKQ